jgi:hypothetical protein
MLDDQQDAFSSVRTESVMVGQIHVFRIIKFFFFKKKGHNLGVKRIYQCCYQQKCIPAVVKYFEGKNLCENYWARILVSFC